MNRREFLLGFTSVGVTAAVLPSGLFNTNKLTESSKKVIDYSYEKINQINDYAVNSIIPSLTTMALYAYTEELFYTLLFLFLLLSSLIII